jgi:hypothetical protein
VRGKRGDDSSSTPARQSIVRGRHRSEKEAARRSDFELLSLTSLLHRSRKAQAFFSPTHLSLFLLSLTDLPPHTGERFGPFRITLILISHDFIQLSLLPTILQDLHVGTISVDVISLIVLNLYIPFTHSI